MGNDKETRYNRYRERIESHDSITDDDKRHIIEFLDGNDPDRHMVQMDDGKTKTYGTLTTYSSVLLYAARDVSTSLTDSDTYTINKLMDAYLNGELDNVKDDGLTPNTVRMRQGVLRRFYRYYDELNVKPSDIHMVDRKETKVDERDVFDGDEIQRIRTAAKNSGSRDAALIDLLLYTGQRINAILTLRNKDIDCDDGIFYLNTSGGGLKGASGKRPLLGAVKSVREWKQNHPTGDPDDHFITQKERQYQDGVEIGSQLSYNSTYEVVTRICDKADIDKPSNPHNFRHTFTTICKRDYGMSNDTIKHLLGHSPDSTVMETTYAHLTDDDYIRDAEEKFGIADPDDNSPLTPPVCDTCGEPLQDNFRKCPYCGHDYAPASDTEEDIRESIFDDATDDDSKADSDELREFKRLLDEHPEDIQNLLNNL